jgi:hypothetical protein
LLYIRIQGKIHILQRELKYLLLLMRSSIIFLFKKIYLVLISFIIEVVVVHIIRVHKSTNQWYHWYVNYISIQIHNIFILTQSYFHFDKIRQKTQLLPTLLKSWYIFYLFIEDCKNISKISKPTLWTTSIIIHDRIFTKPEKIYSLNIAILDNATPKFTLNTELAIFALGQVHCSTPILVPKLGFLKILPPYIFSHECSLNYDGSYIANVLPFHWWATKSCTRCSTLWTR